MVFGANSMEYKPIETVGYRIKYMDLDKKCIFWFYVFLEIISGAMYKVGKKEPGNKTWCILPQYY